MRSVRPLACGLVALFMLATLGAPVGAYPRPADNQRMSVHPDGPPGNRNSEYPVVSADGRFVAYESLATNLGPGEADNDRDAWSFARRVLVHDLATGENEIASVGNDGQWAEVARNIALSADGRHVAFETSSPLDPDDDNGARDIYVRDRATQTTDWVSVPGVGGVPDGTSFEPAISANGRHVAFASLAANLVPGDTNGVADVFVHDRETGQTGRVSVASDGSEANGASIRPSISADGRLVAFRSSASNLVPGVSGTQIYVHDRDSGETRLVSRDNDGSHGTGSSTDPAISADGTVVAFESAASNLMPADTNGQTDLFVHDRGTGRTERVSVSSEGRQAGSGGFRVDLSANGRFVMFGSWSNQLVPEPGNGWFQMYVHDRVTRVTERVSVGLDGGPGDGFSSAPGISADGAVVAYYGQATNLVPEPGAVHDPDPIYGIGFPVLNVYARHRGPAIGVSDLAVADGTITGRGLFAGAVIAAAEPDQDPADGARALGAELRRVELISRPEHPGEQDLLVRWELEELPVLRGEGAHAGAGLPGVVYGLAFRHSGEQYQIRAARNHERGSYTLHRCQASLISGSDGPCEHIADLSGGIGEAGAVATASLPVALLPAGAGSQLTGLQAFTAAGDAATRMLQPLHAVSLPSTGIPVPTVQITVEQAEPPGETVLEAAVEPDEGWFSVDLGQLPSDTYTIHARACLGQECGTASEERDL